MKKLSIRLVNTIHSPVKLDTNVAESPLDFLPFETGWVEYVSII